LTEPSSSFDPSSDQSISRVWRFSRVSEDERFRFLLVGAFNTAFGYTAFVAIQYLFGTTIGYMGSLFCAHVVASSVAFVLYRRLVFKVIGHVMLDYFRFQGVYFVTLTTNVILLPLFVEVFGWNVYLAQGVVMCVTVVGSFLGHKFFSFRRTANVIDRVPLSERKPEATI